MKDVLARANRKVLEEYACSDVLLAFDFDGTLAPIVARPKDAAPRRATWALLVRLARLYRVVVLSGRAQADVERRLQGIEGLQVLGNHGVEAWTAAALPTGDLRHWLAALNECARDLDGVEIEDKTYAIAAHYRRSREKKRARRALLQVARTFEGARVIAGKQVLNVLPLGAPHKGLALERERSRNGCDTAIYVGDDESDEDVFALAQPGRLLSIRVGATRSSAADYCIRDQRRIDALLTALIAYRTTSSASRRAVS